MIEHLTESIYFYNMKNIIKSKFKFKILKRMLKISITKIKAKKKFME